MALQNPYHINLPASALAKPKPLQNPFHIANTQGGDVVTGAMPQPFAAPAAPTAPMAPAPPNFDQLLNADPGYITGNQDNVRQNALAMQQLEKNFRTTSQGYQDNANAHGALFSGAAVNAQRSAAQGYGDQAAQQAANYAQNQNSIATNAWQRILQQLAGGS